MVGKLLEFWTYQKPIFRRACGIRISDDEYIVTGGYFPMAVVSSYDQNGWKYDLPQMNQGRNSHGCQSYIQNNQLVIQLWIEYQRKK